MTQIKQKKCKSCGVLFTPFKTTQKVCSTKCALDLSKLEIDKKEAKEWSKTKKEWKEKNKTRTQKINEAKKVFQAWIRERDTDKPCISCGTTKADDWHGGHYLKAEVYTGLIFDEDNVHKQCLKCNTFLDGNELNYRIGLIKRIGEAAVLRLESIKDSMKSYKWSDDELNEIKKKYVLKHKRN